MRLRWWRKKRSDRDYEEMSRAVESGEYAVRGPAEPMGRPHGPEWTDPLDPHGDGTLRPGDPIFDATMRGNAVHGTFGPNGWKFEEKPGRA